MYFKDFRGTVAVAQINLFFQICVWFFFYKTYIIVYKMYIILNVRSQTVAINNCIILLNLNFYTKIFNKKIVFIFFSDRSNLHNSFFFWTTVVEEKVITHYCLPNFIYYPQHCDWYMHCNVRMDDVNIAQIIRTHTHTYKYLYIYCIYMHTSVLIGEFKGTAISHKTYIG